MSDNILLYVALAGILALLGAQALEIIAGIGKLLIGLATGGLSFIIHLLIGAGVIYAGARWLGRFK